MLLNDWTLGYRGSAYMAPETRVPRLSGALGCGKTITTSMVVSITDGVATTESGSLYSLGDPSTIWREWAAEMWPEGEPDMSRPAAVAVPSAEWGRLK